MSKKPIGLVLKTLINEKNLSADQMAKLIGKSKQQVYNDFNRVGMKDDEIERYANALQIEKQLVYDRMEINEMQSNSSSSVYLMDHLKGLEDQFKLLLNQLEVKDRQIEKLMDLLGKLDPVSDMSKVKLQSKPHPMGMVQSLFKDLKAVC